MSKPVYLEDSAIELLLQTVKRELKAPGIGGDTKPLSLDVKGLINDKLKSNQRAELCFSLKAWAKMTALVADFSTEVEWHGLVVRTSPNSFFIEDILNFEHQVTGSTVVSDYESQQKFWDELPDDVFEKMKMHGHSHVNMATHPSSTDMNYRMNVLRNTGKPAEGYDVFQIFVIWNKHNEHEAQIYDLTNNIQYDTEDIDIKVEFDDGTTLADFIAEAKRLTTPPPALAEKGKKKDKTSKKETKSYPGYYGGGYYGGGYYGGSYYGSRNNDKYYGEKDDDELDYIPNRGTEWGR